MEKRMNLLQRNPSLVSGWQPPRHLEGTGSIPSSLKLFDSGQTPTNKPMATHLVKAVSEEQADSNLTTYIAQCVTQNNYTNA